MFTKFVNTQYLYDTYIIYENKFEKYILDTYNINLSLIYTKTKQNIISSDLSKYICSYFNLFKNKIPLKI